MIQVFPDYVVLSKRLENCNSMTEYVSRVIENVQKSNGMSLASVMNGLVRFYEQDCLTDFHQ